MISQLTVRTRQEGDQIPPELMRGMEPLQIDNHWHWLIEQEGNIVAHMLATPMHGILLLLRMMSLPKHPRAGQC